MTNRPPTPAARARLLWRELHDVAADLARLPMQPKGDEDRAYRRRLVERLGELLHAADEAELDALCEERER